MVDENKVRAIIDYHRQERFSYGDFTSINKAVDIVDALERYLQNKDEGWLYFYLSDHCPSSDYPNPIKFVEPVDDECESPDSCVNCWEAVLKKE